MVSSDERENGLRRVLNLGHTIGHALEAETGYRHFLHGEAVRLGHVSRPSELHPQWIASTGPAPPALPMRCVLWAHCRRSSRAAATYFVCSNPTKKTRNGVVHFVLPREIGKVEIANDVPEQVVIEAVDELRRLSRYNLALLAKSCCGRGRLALAENSFCTSQGLFL